MTLHDQQTVDQIHDEAEAVIDRENLSAPNLNDIYEKIEQAKEESGFLNSVKNVFQEDFSFSKLYNVVTSNSDARFKTTLEKLQKAPYATSVEKAIFKTVFGAIQAKEKLSRTGNKKAVKARVVNDILDSDISSEDEPDKGLTVRDVLLAAQEYGPAVTTVARLAVASALGATAGAAVAAGLAAAVVVSYAPDVIQSFGAAISSSKEERPEKVAKIFSQAGKVVKGTLWHLSPVSVITTVLIGLGVETATNKLKKGDNISTLTSPKAILETVQDTLNDIKKKGLKDHIRDAAHMVGDNAQSIVVIGMSMGKASGLIFFKSWVMDQLKSRNAISSIIKRITDYYFPRNKPQGQPLDKLAA